MVLLDRIFLNRDNPRHDPVTEEKAAIRKLCENEEVLALARDILEHGTNPLEIIGLIEVDAEKTDAEHQSYIVVEGNRRVCALKLLHDPDLAPTSVREQFVRFSEGWTPITALLCNVFPDMTEARLWMERIHNGGQSGVGRRNWTADQKTRFFGRSKNVVAQFLLDYGEKMKFLTPAERSKKLTTVQRFASNEFFRETLGVDYVSPDIINRTRPRDDFDLILRRFLRDLVGGEVVNSRMNKEKIVEYARDLSALEGVTGQRIDPEPINVKGTIASDSARPRRRRSQPSHAQTVQFDREIERALVSLGNSKLRSLYHSICTIDLADHTPIVCVGTWSFFETLTACAGRSPETSFDSFLSKNRLKSYGVATEDVPAIRSAVERIRDHGNSTKHHYVAALFSGDQINNDVITLKGVILGCIAGATANGK